MFQDEQRRANFRCVFSGLGGRQTEVDASIDARGVITCQARHVTVLLPVFLFPTLTEELLRVLLHLVVPLRRRNRIAQRSASNYLGGGKSSVASSRQPRRRSRYFSPSTPCTFFLLVIFINTCLLLCFSTVVMYKCEHVASSCGACRTRADSRGYTCGWCDSTSQCATVDQCPDRHDFRSDNIVCLDPRVTKVSHISVASKCAHFAPQTVIDIMF